MSGLRPADIVKRGDRVKLVACSDEYTTVARGTLGTVLLRDDLGNVHVKWDTGQTLGLIPGVDLWVFAHEEEDTHAAD